MAVASLQTVVVEPIPLSPLPRAYANNAAVSRPRTPTIDGTQQTEIRNRLATNQMRLASPDGQGSSDSEQTLTPSSDGSQNQDQSPQPARRTRYQKLREQLVTALTGNFRLPRNAKVIELDKTIFEDVNAFPDGIPRFAALANSNGSLGLCRRYGRPAQRVLIHDQLNLMYLTEQLDQLDRDDDKNPEMAFRNYGHSGFKADDNKKSELIALIRVKLCEYYDFVEKVWKNRRLPIPTKQQYQVYRDWIELNQPLSRGKYDFIYYAEDFVMTTDENNTFDDFIEAKLGNLPFVKALFTSNDPHRIQKDERYDVEHFSDVRFTILAKLIAVTLAVALLLIPAFILYLVPMSPQGMVWVVFGFVLAFSTTFATVTQGKVQDVFVATAAYAAVLVTFLGNVSQHRT